ncbi:MAG: hypothetical protein JRF69_12655 [Deltaproteobacteria bacterium]|nr:hypothetical protein [Deltaproteobacteria bacterium]
MFCSLHKYKVRPVLCFCFFVSFIAATFVGSSLLGAQPVFEDALGRKITVAKPPRRIVSLAPNITEILYALDIGHRIVGVTIYSDYPDEAKLKPQVGS